MGPTQGLRGSLGSVRSVSRQPIQQKIRASKWTKTCKPACLTALTAHTQSALSRNGPVSQGTDGPEPHLPELPPRGARAGGGLGGALTGEGLPRCVLHAEQSEWGQEAGGRPRGEAPTAGSFLLSTVSFLLSCLGESESDVRAGHPNSLGSGGPHSLPGPSSGPVPLQFTERTPQEGAWLPATHPSLVTCLPK